MNQKLTIVSKKQLTNNVYELVLKGDLVKTMHIPGQFIHIQVPSSMVCSFPQLM